MIMIPENIHRAICCKILEINGSTQPKKSLNFKTQTRKPKKLEKLNSKQIRKVKPESELKMVNSNSNFDSEVNPIHHYQKNSHILDIPKQ